MTQAEQPSRTIEPGTPMQKVIPPRLVEPYLNGQRSVIAGYLYLAQDSAFPDPASYYHALALGYEGSEFSPDMAEICVLRWLALDMTDSLMPAPEPPAGQSSQHRPRVLHAAGTDPGRQPRCTGSRPVLEEFIARYDGQVWLRPVRGI